MTLSVPFVDVVKGVLTGARRSSVAFVQGKVWAVFDATVRVCDFIALNIYEYSSFF